jgi:hypothetical protein
MGLIALVPWGVRDRSNRVTQVTLTESVRSLLQINAYGCFLGSFLGAFEKLLRATISFVMSVRPHRTTRPPLGGSS